MKSEANKSKEDDFKPWLEPFSGMNGEELLNAYCSKPGLRGILRGELGSLQECVFQEFVTFILQYFDDSPIQQDKELQFVRNMTDKKVAAKIEEEMAAVDRRNPEIVEVDLKKFDAEPSKTLLKALIDQLKGILIDKRKHGKGQKEKLSNKDVDAQKQHIKDFLKTLTRPERLLVVLHYYEELNMGEIAKVMELSKSQVSKMRSSIIARGRSYLQEKGLW